MNSFKNIEILKRLCSTWERFPKKRIFKDKNLTKVFCLSRKLSVKRSWDFFLLLRPWKKYGCFFGKYNFKWKQMCLSVVPVRTARFSLFIKRDHVSSIMSYLFENIFLISRSLTYLGRSCVFFWNSWNVHYSNHSLCLLFYSFCSYFSNEWCNYSPLDFNPYL